MFMTYTRSSFGAVALAATPFLLAACSGGEEIAYGTPSALASQCAADNGGLSLPEGFCAIVVHQGVGVARHIEVAENGDLFVAMRNRRDPESSFYGTRMATEPPTPRSGGARTAAMTSFFTVGTSTSPPTTLSYGIRSRRGP
jgi:hypothetical protein